MIDLIKNYPRVFLFLGCAGFIGVCIWIGLYLFAKASGEEKSFKDILATHICVGIICLGGICIIYTLQYCFRRDSDEQGAHQSQSEYYSEMFAEGVVYTSEDSIRIPAFNEVTAMDDELKTYFLAVIDIGIMLPGRKELIHPTAGWTLTTDGDAAIHCRISSDGKKLLIVGEKPGDAVIHIQHMSAFFSRDLPVAVRDWETFRRQEGIR